MTLVVNLRVSDYDVYVGRPGKGQEGYFGNPIRVGEDCFVCGNVHGKGETLGCFEAYVRQRLAVDPEYKARVKGLQGKLLGCFCKPRPCHGDILAKYADAL